VLDRGYANFGEHPLKLPEKGRRGPQPRPTDRPKALVMPRIPAKSTLGALADRFEGGAEYLLSGNAGEALCFWAIYYVRHLADEGDG
jgi:hypothetical protein